MTLPSRCTFNNDLTGEPVLVCSMGQVANSLVCSVGAHLVGYAATEGAYLSMEHSAYCWLWLVLTPASSGNRQLPKIGEIHLPKVAIPELSLADAGCSPRYEYAWSRAHLERPVPVCLATRYAPAATPWHYRDFHWTPFLGSEGDTFPV